MASSSRAQGPHPRIIVGLPDIQDHIRMVRRLSAAAAEPEQGRWDGLGDLLCELYAQLQHKKQVTIFRFGSKSSSAPKTGRRHE
jgi:hypothetical protein